MESTRGAFLIRDDPNPIRMDDLNSDKAWRLSREAQIPI
jgi:hypothetical protein